MFHSFFNSLARSRYLSLFLLSFNSTLGSTDTAKFTIRTVLFFFLFSFFFFFFLLTATWCGRLAEIRWSVYISKSQRTLCVSFSGTDSGCAYTICWYSQIRNFFHNSQGITLPTLSYLVLYSFCTNLQHSLIIWMILSFLSSQNLHFLFCSVLSILLLCSLSLWRCFMLVLEEIWFLS